MQYGTFGITGAAFALFTYGTPALDWSQWGASFTGGSMSLGVWTHVAATSTSGTVTLFQDGRAVASQALFPTTTRQPARPSTSAARAPIRRRRWTA